jgi:Ca2+-transporting ATPase
MSRPPRSPTHHPGAGLWHAVWVGLLMGGIALAVQAWARGRLALATMVFASAPQLASPWRCQAQIDPPPGLPSNMPLLVTVILTASTQLALIYVPAFQPIFETEALGLEELVLVALVTPIPFIAVEIEKWVVRRRERRQVDVVGLAAG